MVKKLPAMQEPKEIWVRSLGQKDPLEEGMATHSTSCLENLMNRGDWHGVAKSRTQLKRLSTHTFAPLNPNFMEEF